MELESSHIKEWGVLTSSEDFILSGKNAFEKQFTKELPNTFLRWNVEEGKLVYAYQNLLSFQFLKGSLISGFPLALQTLSYLSGYATLTWCYAKAIENLNNNLESIGDHLIEVFAYPTLDFEKLKLEKITAISCGRGKVVENFIDDSIILETTDIASLKRKLGLTVFACRAEKAFNHLLSLNPGIIHLALHRSMDVEKLISRVPISIKLGIWGNIPYTHLSDVFHSQWSFILPSNLSYPPLVDLFIKSH